MLNEEIHVCDNSGGNRTAAHVFRQVVFDVEYFDQLGNVTFVYFTFDKREYHIRYP